MGYDDYQQRHQQVYGQDAQPHESSWGHEFVAGGAAFAAMHEWENHQKNEGQAVNHGFAKEAVAGIAGAEVDKLFETHGLDWIDKEKTKRHAEREAEQLYDNSYGNQQQYGRRNEW